MTKKEVLDTHLTEVMEIDPTNIQDNQKPYLIALLQQGFSKSQNIKLKKDTIYKIHFDNQTLPITLSHSILKNYTTPHQQHYEVIEETVGRGGMAKAKKNNIHLSIEGDQLNIEKKEQILKIQTYVFDTTEGQYNKINKKKHKEWISEIKNEINITNEFYKTSHLIQRQYLKNNLHKSKCYFFMPKILNDDLARFLKNNPNLPIEKRLIIAYNVADAVAKLHKKGYVHRDIKIENFRIDPKTLKIKLIDFGLAKKNKTHENKSGGTLEYLSLEAAEEKSTQASDIYSLTPTLALILGATNSVLFQFKRQFDTEDEHYLYASYAFEDTALDLGENMRKQLISLLEKTSYVSQESRPTINVILNLLKSIQENIFGIDIKVFKEEIEKVNNLLSNKYNKTDYDPDKNFLLKKIANNIIEIRDKIVSFDGSMVIPVSQFEANYSELLNTLNNPDTRKTLGKNIRKIDKFVNGATRPISFLTGAISQNENRLNHGFRVANTISVLNQAVEMIINARKPAIENFINRSISLNHSC